MIKMNECLTEYPETKSNVAKSKIEANSILFNYPLMCAIFCIETLKEQIKC